MNTSELTARWAPVCDAVARLLSPHAEVVLHDARTDRVLALWNPVSGRRPGDPSLLGELDALRPAGPDVYGPYQKLLPDGRRMSSVSAVLRDGGGHADAVLCVNVDRTAFDAAAQLLASFAAPVEEQPGVLFERDWLETVNQVVGAHVRARGVPVERLTREDRRDLVEKLEDAGVFTRQRAVPAVARTLRVSRSTVYDLLAQLRRERARIAAGADAS